MAVAFSMAWQEAAVKAQAGAAPTARLMAFRRELYGLFPQARRCAVRAHRRDLVRGRAGALPGGAVGGAGVPPGARVGG